MSLARWQATITDDAGNILPGASVTVRRETTGAPLASLYSDRAGATPIGNPATADAVGFVSFHVVGGAYRITATSGSDTRDWRYVAIGLAAEGDGAPPGAIYVFDDGTSDSDPGPGALRFNHATPLSATYVYLDALDDFGVSQAAWIATFDDGGMSANRGTLVLRSADGAAFLTATVTGAVTDGGGYYKLAITPLTASAAGSFIDGVTLGVSFMRSGSDGAVVGAASAVVGQFAVFSATDGEHLTGAVVAEGSPTEPITVGAIADVAAATPGAMLEAGLLRTASALATLTDAATVAFDWTAGVNFTLTLAGNRILGNPSGGIPGTWRTIYVAGNDATNRTLTFASNYGGLPPTLTDIDNALTYLLSVYCVTASHFIVSKMDASPP